MPAARMRTIATTFNRIHSKRETVSKSFVAQVILQYRHAIAMQRRDMRNRMPMTIPANAIWGLDLCGKQDIVGALPIQYWGLWITVAGWR